MNRTYGGAAPRIHPRAFVHDSAELIGDVRLGAQASVWPLCCLRGDVDRIVVGERSNIQDLTVIHCDKGRPTIVGKGVTVGHRVVLHGSRIGDRCLIGMGSIVLDGAVIGEDSLVAAGSLVTPGTVVPPRSVVMGRPARVTRATGEDELQRIRESAANYIRYALDFMTSCKRVL